MSGCGLRLKVEESGCTALHGPFPAWTQAEASTHPPSTLFVLNQKYLFDWDTIELAQIIRDRAHQSIAMRTGYHQTHTDCFIIFESKGILKSGDSFVSVKFVIIH